MNMQNGSKKTPHKEEKLYGEYPMLATIFMASLLLSFSILYMSDSKPFKESNKQLILIIETGSATLAIIAFTLDRFKLTDKFPAFIKWLLNMATLAFFLVTVPHLFASSIDDAYPETTTPWIMVAFSFLVLVSIVFYAISLFTEKPGAISFVSSLIMTALVFSLIHFMTMAGITQKLIILSQGLLEIMGLGF